MKTLIKLASQKGNPPILNCILFSGNTARATDCEAFASTSGSWYFDTPRVVDAKLVKGALSLNSKKPVWAGTTLNGVELVASNVMDAVDFPIGSEFAGGVALEFAGDINAILARVTPAMAKSDLRYCLNGLMVNSDGVIAATNGHRLHVERDAFSVDDRKFEAIIPSQVFDLLPSVDSITLSPTHARVTLGQTVLVSKLIDEKFPDYQRVVPKSSERPIAIQFNGAQTSVVDKLLKFSKANKEKWHTMTLNSQSGAIIASVSGLELPFSDAYEGDDVCVVANVQYILDAMQAAHSGELRMATRNDSLLFTSLNFKAVVMQFRV